MAKKDGGHRRHSSIIAYRVFEARLVIFVVFAELCMIDADDDIQPGNRHSMRRVGKYLMMAAGALCVVLAVLGIFLPLLPTTPFLLLAAFLFARSSSSFYDWLIMNRWFGEYIRNYREGRGIPLRQKISTILILWMTIVLGVWLVPVIWSRLGMIAIATGVTVHLLRMKTYRPEDQPKPVKDESISETC
jgi:uncharacterized membrane protein YbaN (DUF454 family)